MLAAATQQIGETVGEVLAIAGVIDSTPIGPSHRRYANGAMLLRTQHGPRELLGLLQAIERAFGRRAGGRRWGARVLDLDIVLWSGGRHAAPGLVIPHAAFRTRDFVLAPAAAIAARWRDPLTGLTLRQLRARLTARRPLP